MAGLFVVECYFDTAGDAAVRRIWSELAAAGVATPGAEPEARPHVTLLAYERGEFGGEEALAGFAREVPPFELDFGSLGLFPPTTEELVVFVAPVVTADLLALQARAAEALRPTCGEPLEYYRPANWVPHCTLTQHCPPDRTGEVLAICQLLPLPLRCRVEAIGLIEARPVRQRAFYPLLVSDQDFAFRPVTAGDLPLIHRWRNDPVVARWWDPAPTYDEVAADLMPRISGEEPVYPYIALYRGTPIGYLQWCRLAENPGHAAERLAKPGAAGIDLFVGEDAYRGRGLGAAMVRAFTREIIFGAPDVTECYIDPDPGNAVAIRAYLRAGYRDLGIIANDAWGDPAHLLRLGREELVGR